MIKKFIFIIILFILNCCFVNTAIAENFYITYYDVNINVNKDKSVDVKEEINAYFTTPSHGIYRDIPTTKKDKITYAAAFKDPYSVFQGTNNTRIKIGSQDKYVSGPKQYKINYTYNIRDNKDEFYFNIIGTGWDTDIYNANFEITLPAPVDPSKVGLSIGEYGTKGFKDNAVYFVSGNRITGKTLEKLPPNNGITIRIEVPEDYFIQDKRPDNKNAKAITIVLMILSAWIAFMLWFIYGRDKHITPIVTFYPPKGLNSAQVGIIYDGQSNTKQIVSLIYYLATKGYIKIVNNTNNFKIIKLKEHNDINSIEAMLMESLFSELNKTDINKAMMEIYNKGKKYEVSDENSVTEDELKYSKSFYQDMQSIENNINKYKNQIFTLTSLGKGKNTIMISLLILVCTLITFALSNYTFKFFTEGFIFGLFPIIGLSIVITIFLQKNIPLIGRIFIILWGAGFIGIPLGILYSEEIFSFDEKPVIYLGLLCALIIRICWQNLPQWTENARKLRGEILGFRKFLQVAEKTRIEQLIKENPNYCTDLIPYAYVLGVTDTWMKKIETMINNPEWFSGELNHYSFNNISESLNNYSSPSNNNGGISSSHGGGGHSGGGHGGGGGGSW